MTKKLSDAELFESGQRARAKGQCGLVIVATDDLGRTYHQCSGAADHIGPGVQPGWHYCGCGQEWRMSDAGWVTTGPLRDVVFPS
jgi:hypothetical protein